MPRRWARGSISISSTGDASGAIIEGGSLARFNGFWMATDQFVIPAGARHMVLSFSDFNADDRAVLELNREYNRQYGDQRRLGSGRDVFHAFHPVPALQVYARH